MRIRPSDISNIISNYSNSKSSEETSNTQSSNKTSLNSKRMTKDSYDTSAVRADISKDYDTYHKAIKEIKSQETEARNMKIQNLKKQIEEGTYEVKPELIAQSIMDKLG